MSKVGIVVIGRNEGSRLEACLRSLPFGGGPIVYADSASSDGSPALAASLGAFVIALDPGRPMNAARGRKEGTDVLVGLDPALDYVFYIDGDCLLEPDFLPKAIAFLDEHPNAAAVCGQRFEAHPGASFYNRLSDEEWNTPVGQADACGGDSLMRLRAVLAVGGFDPNLMASEEPELSARMRAAGWEIWRIDARMTQHDAGIFSFGAYWRRNLRAGVGYYQAWRKTARLGHPINGTTLKRALLWAGIVPAIAILAALALRDGRALLIVPIAYTLQIIRMALRAGAGDIHNWKVAAALMLIKPAELLGAARAALRGGRLHSIAYKGR